MNILEIMKKNLILILAITAGLFSIYFFGDRNLDNEWQVMVYNLETNNILSSRKINGVLVPNIFMPPLYPIFLFIIKKILFNSELYLTVILLIQLYFHLLSAHLLKKILNLLFEKKFSNLGFLIFLFFPLSIYAVGQISSINLQILLLLVFIYNFIKISETNSKISIVFFSVASALLMLLRGEFFIFFIFTLIYLFLIKKNFLTILIALFVSILVLSPYLVRNYKIFQTITITKSAGFNLLKGNNPLSKVEGIGMWYGYDVVPDLKDELANLRPIEKYDLLADPIFLDRAVQFIKEDPKRYIKLYFKKVLSFFLIDFDSSYPGYYSIFNTLPKILFSILSLISIIIFSSLRVNLYNYFVLFYFLNIGLFSFFFILPRYTLSLLPIQIILSMFLIKKIVSKYQ
jgi:hypothetical protein|tara:strand:+ start:676 stop:1881 length:1206 start_codon:yes stop_codon:yes gene_type:complete